MLLCKQIHCRWHLVYIISSQIMRRRLAAFQEREPNVQNCFYLVRAHQHPVRPPVRSDRPPAAGLRGDDDPQRRHSALRRLRFPSRPRRARTVPQTSIWPRFFGAIFFAPVSGRALWCTAGPLRSVVCDELLTPGVLNELAAAHSRSHNAYQQGPTRHTAPQPAPAANSTLRIGI